MRFLNVRKKVRDWVGLNAIVDIVEVVCWIVEMWLLIRKIEEWRL